MRKFVLHTGWMAWALALAGLVLIAAFWMAVSPVVLGVADVARMQRPDYSAIWLEASVAGSESARGRIRLAEPVHSVSFGVDSCPCLADRPFWQTFLSLVPSDFVHRAVERSCGCERSCRGRDLI